MIKKVYLCGGFHSGWQDEVKKIPGYYFFDPRYNPPEPFEYTWVDIQAIESCDILLANLEPDNPGLYDAMFEIGYAAALGKRIVIILPEDRKYMTMVPIVAQQQDTSVRTVESAISWLIHNAK